MKRAITIAALLAMSGGAVLASESSGPPRGGPPIDEIATELNLTEQQKAEVNRIFDEAHARMETSRRESREQVDKELAVVLTPEQLEQFKSMMQRDRGHRRGPPQGPPASDH